MYNLGPTPARLLRKHASYNDRYGKYGNKEHISLDKRQKYLLYHRGINPQMQCNEYK